MTTFLVYGSKGWIGSMVIDYLKTNGFSYTESINRIDDTNNITIELDSIKPSNVICLIGRTHGKGFTTIDYLEQPGKLRENINDNLFSPVSLAIECQKRNIHLTYLGTGCIFNQDIDDIIHSHGYQEHDLPDFFGSGYSTVKGFTDRLMHQFDNVLNLRIRMPIVGYDHPRNFITKIKSYTKIINVQNSMTVLPDIIPIIIDLSQKHHVGTINLTNPGTISHNQILDMYKQYIDPSIQFQNFTVDEQNTILASKRSNNKLCTKQIELLYPNLKNIKHSLEDLFKNW